jgi:hypothetical protein
MNKKILIKEKVTRELEKRFELQRTNLVEFMKLYFKEETPKGIPQLLVDDYIYIIVEHLMQVLE